MKRRDFLKSSGALIVAFSSAGVADVFGQGRFDGPGTPQLDAWLAIAGDGSVTAYTGKVELGHGLADTVEVIAVLPAVVVHHRSR